MGLRQLSDTGEDIGEPSLRLEVVELDGDDKGIHRCGAHAASARPQRAPRRGCVDPSVETSTSCGHDPWSATATEAAA